MKLRDYQLKAVEAVELALSQNQSTLLVMPTGTGKTIVLAHAIARRAGRALVIAHREELIRQAVDKIGIIIREVPDIEMANAVADLHLYNRSKVVVASKDSLQGSRLLRFAKDEFDLIVTDEAHHSVATRYGNVYAHFSEAKHLGVTATPDRLDALALGRVFDSVAFEYQIPDAINDGWLVPIMQRSVFVTGLDFSAVKTTAGDLNSRQLAEIMESERMLHEIVTPTIELAGSRRVLMFTASVKHAERAASILNRHKPDSARWVCGETAKDVRAATLRDYKAGRFQYLVNVGVFTEGFDEPGIEVVVMARPTKSRALYAQMIGRGTRPLAGIVDAIDDTTEDAPQIRRYAIRSSAKPSLLVLDFEGNSGKHKLITTADILGGNYTDEVIARVKAQTRELSKTFDVDTEAALREAQAQLTEEHEERKRVEVKAKRAEFVVNAIDPFDVMQMEPCRERGWDMAKPPSERMIRTLDNYGIDARHMSKKHAGQLIRECISRRAKGRCTYKQAKVLSAAGYSPDISFEAASSLITEIIQARYRGARA